MPYPTLRVPVPAAASSRRAHPLALLALLATAACGPGLEPIVRPAPAAAARVPVAAERPAPTEAPAEDGSYLAWRQLMVPVAGVEPERLRDDFLAPRDGGARAHRAIDILAPRGTPVLAADDGLVYRVSSNRLGGRTVYLLDLNQRFIYYYAHLDRYRDGLREGERLARGAVLGYVGTTGNAPDHIPHLHFQAMRFRRDRYWDGEPVNPKPYLFVPGVQLQVSAANEDP